MNKNKVCIRACGLYCTDPSFGSTKQLSHSLTALHALWHTWQPQTSCIAVCPWPALGWSCSCGPSLL